MALLKSLLTLWVWKVTRPAWAMFSKLKASVGLEKVSVIIFSIMQKMITGIIKIHEFLKWARSLVEGHATGRFIRSCVSFSSEQFRACCVG